MSCILWRERLFVCGGRRYGVCPHIWRIISTNGTAEIWRLSHGVTFFRGLSRGRVGVRFTEGGFSNFMYLTNFFLKNRTFYVTFNRAK
jgi:hypothetical protein